ncbi:MAG: amidase, partial [Alphaproteobacteria bacterium]
MPVVEPMASFTEYETFDAVALAALVRAGEISPRELLDAAIARAEARNPRFNFLACRLYDQAAAVIETGLPDGPLCGVPFLIKDLYTFVAGAPLGNGSRLFAGYVTDFDEELIRRYRRAGLVLFG